MNFFKHTTIKGCVRSGFVPIARLGAIIAAALVLSSAQAHGQDTITATYATANTSAFRDANVVQMNVAGNLDYGNFDGENASIEAWYFVSLDWLIIDGHLIQNPSNQPSYNSLILDNDLMVTGNLFANLTSNSDIAVNHASFSSGGLLINGTLDLLGLGVNFTDNEDDSSVIAHTGTSATYLSDNYTLSLGGESEFYLSTNQAITISSANMRVDLGHTVYHFRNNSGNIGVAPDKITADTLVLNALDAASPSINLQHIYLYDGGGSLQFSYALGADPAGQRISATFSLGTNGTFQGVLYPGGLGIGSNASASANQALAFGNSSASGNYAFAAGDDSQASGNGSLSLGGGNATDGNSTAIGSGAVTGAANTVAIGINTLAQTNNTVVMGHDNEDISWRPAAWNNPPQPAFIVGSGTSGSGFNAFEIENDGGAFFGGQTLVASPDYVSPTSSTQPLTLEIDGASIFSSSNMTLSGNVFMSHAQGDISMGPYGN